MKISKAYEYYQTDKHYSLNLKEAQPPNLSVSIQLGAALCIPSQKRWGVRSAISNDPKPYSKGVVNGLGIRVGG